MNFTHNGGGTNCFTWIGGDDVNLNFLHALRTNILSFYDNFYLKSTMLHFTILILLYSSIMYLNL